MYTTNLDADGWFRGDSLLDGEDSIDNEHFQRVRQLTDAIAVTEDDVKERLHHRAELFKELAELKEQHCLHKNHNRNPHNISGYPGFQDQRAQPHRGNDDDDYEDQQQDSASGVTAEDYTSEEMADHD